MNDKHLPALDGLRGVAAFWVLVGHVAQNTPVQSRLLWLPLNNGLAVDLFMILSGFLMFYLHHDVEDTGYARFVVRRYFRLAPLFYVCLVVSFAVAPWFAAWGSRTWQHAGVAGWTLVTTPASFLAHLTFLFGLLPLYQACTALPDWSLSLEAQFYLLFPLIAKILRRHGVGVASLLVLAIIAASTLVLRVTQVDYIFPSFLPLKLHVFFAGMLVGKLVRDGLGARIALVALAAILFPFVPGGWRYDLTRAVMLVLVYLGASPSRFRAQDVLKAVLGHPVLRWAGELSYGVYLTHLIVMYAAIYLLLPVLADHLGILFLASLAVTTLVSYAVSYLLHVWVEKPGIVLGRSIIRRMGRATPTLGGMDVPGPDAKGR